MATRSQSTSIHEPPPAAKVIAPKPTRNWRAWVFQSYMLTATLAFGVLVVLASFTNYFPFDLSSTRAVQTINSVWFAHLMWIVSFIGYSPQGFILITAIILILFALGLRWEAVMAGLAAGGASSLGALVKIIVHRPRPTADLVLIARQLNDYSFPSGHVLLYTAFFGFLLFLAYTLLKPSVGRGLLIVVLGGLVVLVGPSRIYLGGHWASDVVGAYLLGSLWLSSCIVAYRWGKTRFFVRQPVAAEKPEPPASRPVGNS